MIYIYPYGGFGKCAARILDIFGLAYTPLDDALGGLPKSFKDDDVVLIAISSGYDEIKDKLKGRVKFQNATLFCADLILKGCAGIAPQDIIDYKAPALKAIDEFYSIFSEHYRDLWEAKLNKAREILGCILNEFYKKRLSQKVQIGIYLVRELLSKHLYKIPEILSKKLGEDKIIYIYYKKSEQNRPNSLIIHYRLMEFIDFLPNVITTSSSVATHKNTKSFCIDHVFACPFGLYTAGLSWYKRFYKASNINFLFSACLKNYEFESEHLSEFMQVIKGGYPSLDKNLDEFKPALSPQSVLICPRYDNFFYPHLKEIVNAILQSGYKVIYRPHPAEQIRLDIKHENFTYDFKTPIIKAIAQSFTCLTNFSSTAHTYALTKLKKSIVFMPQAFYDSGFYDEHLHNKASNIDEILAQIKKDASMAEIERERESIRRYLKEQVFNLNHSSEFIAGFILDNI